MAAGPSRRLAWVGWAIAVVAVVLLAGAAAIALWIQTDVRRTTDMAVREYPGDGVQALIAYVDTEDHPLADRNRAVWALGQMREPRALPVLERHYTGQPCDHARMLCQYELKKAIDLIRRSAKQAR